MMEDDINQMFPSNKVGILAAALRDDQSSCVLGLGRAFTVPIDLSAQRPASTKIFRAKKHAFISSRNTSAYAGRSTWAPALMLPR
jgi:hypothetical protein